MKSLKAILLGLCLLYGATSAQLDDSKIVDNAKREFEEADADRNHIISLK